MAKKRVLQNILLVMAALFISLILLELGFRLIIFNDIPAFERLRNPANYADSLSDDDYGKLDYLFGHQPPKKMHPVLGWVNESKFSPETYLHTGAEDLQGRRPVLLYGDSFANCNRDTTCFEDILNRDETFSGDHYLLNYGVGGYGVDQIYLLLKNSVHLYDRPFVVVSLMTLDLDRSVLSVRSGVQKPYFRIEDGRLKRDETPINLDPHQFFADNPPQIRSYIYRRILYAYLPPQAIHSLRSEERRIEQKKEINQKIILTIIEELRANDIDFVFLIFHPHWPGIATLDQDNWRDQFLRELLEKENAPYIWSKDLFEQDTQGRNFAIGQYILPDGHPTSYFNQLIVQAIKRHVLENSE